MSVFVNIVYSINFALTRLNELRSRIYSFSYFVFIVFFYFCFHRLCILTRTFVLSFSVLTMLADVDRNPGKKTKTLQELRSNKTSSKRLIYSRIFSIPPTFASFRQLGKGKLNINYLQSKFCSIVLKIGK